MAIEKQILREQLKASRPQSSSGLTEMLLQLVEKLKPKTIASYQPQAAEPDVSEFNQRVSQYLNLVFPRVVGSDLEFASGEMTAGVFGILEPTGKTVTEIDLLIIPALAVDKSGNRLGKGKGFYDRFLKDFPGPSYAVVHDTEVLALLPAEPHDQKLSGAVTPTRILTF
jgi:5-formyltetrahydrofolate cyclo-ligase